MLEAGRARAALVGRDALDRLVEAYVRVLPVEEACQLIAESRSRFAHVEPRPSISVWVPRPESGAIAPPAPASRLRPPLAPPRGLRSVWPYRHPAPHGWSRRARNNRCSRR